METGSIVIALVREYTAETPLNLAIYYGSPYFGPFRISQRDNIFLLEVKDSNNEYQNLLLLLIETLWSI
jgi:hypothetical protein